MTTLPTRPDGGIDWDSIIETSAGVAWHIGRGEMRNVPSVEFAKMVARHTRERAEKVAEDGAGISLSVALEAMDGTGVEAAKIAIAIRDDIRNMEV